MKKLLFGLAFLGSMAFVGFAATVQGSVGGEEGSTICCQKTGSFCQDRFGNAYSDSIESPGPTCTKP